MGLSWENKAISKVKREKREQKQAITDNTELALAIDEATLDLTDLVMAQAEEIENLKNQIKNLQGGESK